MERLGLNQQGYCGERIRIEEVLRGCVEAARSKAWRVEEMAGLPGADLIAFTRPALSPEGRPSRVYLSTGIHGDEPAGPLAMRRLLAEDQWPARADLYVCPCLNPAGFRLGRRENGDGVDLNRDYLRPTAKETQAHLTWLERQPPFDFCLCLHEDWEAAGFYLYELNPLQAPSPAEEIIRRVAPICPIERAGIIEGRVATDGIIRPNLDPSSRPQWPEAFYLLTRKTRLSCTLEAPSDFPLPVRVDALVAGAMAAIRFVCGENQEDTWDR
jgi:hypothetical protein